MIGDVLTTSVLFEALKQKYPDSKLHYVINSHTYPVVENNPFIDEFIFFTPEIEKSKRKFYSFLKTLKTKNYDAVIDVYGKLSSNLISYFTNAPKKISYKKKLSKLFYTHEIERKKKPEYRSSLALENRMLLLETLNVSFNSIQPKIYLKNEEVNEAKLLLEKSNIDLAKPIFMISVLGSSIEKTYPLKYMSKLLDAIISKTPNSQILFNYIPNQEKDAKEVYNNCLKSTQEQIFFNIYGKSLREFLAITSHCTALIGNEGGANNMAKALNIPTFTIFSPYLNKQNWFGSMEIKKHRAVHLSDFTDYSKKEKELAKKDPKTYYHKFKPEYIIPELESFLGNFE